MDEKTIRQWINEELDRRNLIIQNKCRHVKGGTFQADGSITCNDCQGILSGEEGGPNAPSSSISL